jgi:tyrosyl-tRNA synthetase
MDLERRLELVKRAPTEEILLEDELRTLLETEAHPIAYDGWEPSGPVHLGTGLICAYKMKDLIEAGFEFKAYLATWHAWINNKLGGEMELIKKAAKHFAHAWIACGVPEDKIKFIWPHEVYDDLAYWEIVVKVAKEMTVARAKRTLEIAGRKESEVKKVAELMYTPMQVADIFHFDIDVCQLGMDQRKANVVAREIGEKIGFWKPVCVHHHLLQGLVAPPVWPLPEDPVKKKEILSAIKMSKSKPETCVYLYDEPNAIKNKIAAAFCPPRESENNPIIDIAKHIVFRERDEIVIERPTKYGGKLEVQSYEELKRVYGEGALHPTDLKNAVAENLIEILAPVRDYFEKHREAKEIKDYLLSTKITR